MALLHRYLLRQVGPPALIAFVVIAFLAMIAGLRQQISELPLDQVTLGDLTRLSFLSLPALIAYIVPITYMMGILAGFGGLAQANAFVAMKAAGIPMRRLILSVIGLGALLSVGCFLVQDQVRPWAMRQAIRLIYSDLPLRASIDLLPPGVMHEFADWRVYIGDKDTRTNTLRDIVILRPEDTGETSAFYADSAQLVRDPAGSTLVLTNGSWIQSRGLDRVFHAESPRMELSVPKLMPKEPKREREGMTLRELLYSEVQLAQTYAETQALPTYAALLRERGEISDRLALPLMCLAVSLVAAPLAVRSPRTGRSFIFAIGFVMLISYFTLNRLFEPRLLMPLHQVVLMGQAPNLVLGAAGLVFVWRVDRV
ncbi:MAG TPA: LptF/LptG family permease [Candidatus Hydrogenedentes bacterium]|nr:LptF/LptG family permease [Candidatus Hydrogenedentota bacterium]HNT86420.1 LptF/LptG family permease [Candidatus Hydrogenedentota bacterium]